MIAAEEVTQFKNLLDQSETVLVLFSAEATVDHVASAIAVYRAMLAMGKEATLVAAQHPEFPEKAFGDLSFIQTELGNRNLTVSFAYDEQAVDKVSYHIGEETQRFYLTIRPKKGHKPLVADSVSFSYTGAEADCIVLVGVSSFEQLGAVYVGYEKFFSDTPIVTVNSYQPDFGVLHLDTSGRSSVSETMIPLYKELGLSLDDNTATMLFYAVEQVTRGFQSLSITAETFEAAAALLKAGARRTNTYTSEHKRGEVSVQLDFDESEAPLSKKQAPNKDGSKKRNEMGTKKPGDLQYQPGGNVSRT